MNKNEQSLSVVSCGSIDNNWQKKPKRPIFSKIIKRDVGDHAMILAEDPSKSIRFLYLTLLTQKSRIQHIKTIIMKIKRIITEKTQFQFQDMTLQMKQIDRNLESILKNLKILQLKMQKYQQDQLIIIKLCQQHSTVDPLLILTFRLIANSQEFKIKSALCCSTPISFANVYQIMRKFGVNKDEKNQLNRFVIFFDLKQIDVKFFKASGINIQQEAHNSQELFDAYLQKYEQQIILEQLYCQL